MFNFTQPFFIVRDPELMKLFCIKEFDSFTDHMTSLNADMDPLLGNILTMLQGKKWKDMRNTLSPAFTGKFLI